MVTWVEDDGFDYTNLNSDLDYDKNRIVSTSLVIKPSGPTKGGILKWKIWERESKMDDDIKHVKN